MEGKGKKGRQPKQRAHDQGATSEPSHAQPSTHSSAEGFGQNTPSERGGSSRGGSSRGKRQGRREGERGWEQDQGQSRQGWRQGQEGFQGRDRQENQPKHRKNDQGATHSSAEGFGQNTPSERGGSSRGWRQGRWEGERGWEQDQGQSRQGWRQGQEGFEGRDRQENQPKHRKNDQGATHSSAEGFGQNTPSERGGSSRGWRQGRWEGERGWEQDQGQSRQGWRQGQEGFEGRNRQGWKEESISSSERGQGRDRGRGFGRRGNIIQGSEKTELHVKEEQAISSFSKQQPHELEKTDEKQKQYGDYDSEQRRSGGGYQKSDRRGRGYGSGRGAYGKKREIERSDQQGKKDGSLDNRRDQRERGDFYKGRELSRSDSVDSSQSGGNTNIKKREELPTTPKKESTPLAVPPKTTVETSQKPSTSRETPPGTSSKKPLGVVETSSGFSIPHRKNIGSGVVGTRGKKLMLEVNHLCLELKKSSASAFHYDVEFKQKLPKKLLRQAMQEFKRSYSPEKPFAFDGMKNVYSCGKLPFGEELCRTVTIFDEERQMERECEVYIKCVSEVDMSSLMNFIGSFKSNKLPQEAIQCLDIVLRNAGSMRFTPVGRSFFSPPQGGIINLGEGFELWRGFYQSVNLGWKPYLNVDVAHKAFPSAVNLIEFIMELLRTRDPRALEKPLDYRCCQELEAFVKGLKIEYSIPSNPQTRRTYKVNRLKKTAYEERFQLDDKRVMSVGEYFEKEKKYRLKFPNMPCLHVGSVTKNIYVPVELCTVVKGQSTNRKLTPNQTSEMVRNAAEPSNIRKQRIMRAIQEAGFNNDPCAIDFGVSVSNNFAKVPARILDPPDLVYADKNVSPLKGVWRAQKLLNTNPLRSWVILDMSFRKLPEAMIRNFIQNLRQSGTNMGVNINDPHEVQQLTLKGRVLEGVSDKFNALKRKYETLQLIVVIIEEKSYGAVKNAAELKVGVLTQCVKSRTMSKMNIATSSNILLKINAKLNGVNNSVNFPRRPIIFEKPVMIVGADVTHPSPGEEGVPSVAAVTSSFDPTAFKCNMSWKIQPPRQELIVDLKNIMKDHLMFFYQRNNGLKPEKIIYYRDGVGEGQFAQVLDVEFKAIRQACSEYPDYKPAITILIVQKRHHTRFFPLSKQYEEGRGNNVPAGTIVDTDITHPKEMDFYLVSHASLQGTARPTKYHKIWDDSDFSDDDLEELTFYLCHLFARCTRSVSYPAQTYYAHLAAFRARKAYLEGPPINISNLEREQELRSINNNIIEENPMFYV